MGVTGFKGLRERGLRGFRARGCACGSVTFVTSTCVHVRWRWVRLVLLVLPTNLHESARKKRWNHGGTERGRLVVATGTRRGWVRFVFSTKGHEGERVATNDTNGHEVEEGVLGGVGGVGRRFLVRGASGGVVGGCGGRGCGKRARGVPLSCPERERFVPRKGGREEGKREDVKRET